MSNVISIQAFDGGLDQLEQRYSHLAVCETTEERNTAYHEADSEDMPIMWLLPKRKYGEVRTDLITLSNEYSGLDDDAVSDVANLNYYFLGMTLEKSKKSHRSDVESTIGSGCPGMKGLHLDDMPVYAYNLAEILFNKENWKERNW